MLFSATFTDALLLQKTIGVLHDLVHECSATISEEGIAIQSMDSSHVCLVSINWTAKTFSSYLATELITIGIHIGNFLKILKCCNKSDAVTIEIDETASDTMSVTFRDDTRTASFFMKLMEWNEDQITIPEMEYGAIISMDSSEFQMACRDLSIIGDTTTITIDENGLTFVSSGDIGHAMLTYNNVERQGSEEITQSFALRYLNSFSKGTIFSSRVSLKSSANMPLVIEYMNEVSYISFYLAPKIEDDDDATEIEK